jgi:hypothetical protein
VAEPNDRDRRLADDFCARDNYGMSGADRRDMHHDLVLALAAYREEIMQPANVLTEAERLLRDAGAHDVVLYRPHPHIVAAGDVAIDGWAGRPARVDGETLAEAYAHLRKLVGHG